MFVRKTCAIIFTSYRQVLMQMLVFCTVDFFSLTERDLNRKTRTHNLPVKH